MRVILWKEQMKSCKKCGGTEFTSSRNCKKCHGIYKVVCILEQEDYKPGDQPPEGYLAWHEWAEVQRKAGIKQVQCGRCGLWKTPQELSGQNDRCEMQSRKGPVIVVTPVCNKCATPNVQIEARPAFGASLSNAGLGYRP